MVRKAEQEHDLPQSDSLEVLFSTKDSATVYIKPGEHETEHNLRYRYSFLFSKEQAVRNYREPKRFTGNIYGFDAYEYLSGKVELDLEQFGDPEVDSYRILLQKKQQADRMTQLLFEPPKSVEITNKRQQIIRELVESPELDEIIQLKNAALCLSEGIWGFSAIIEPNPLTETSLIELYLAGEKRIPDEDDYYGGWWNQDEKEELSEEDSVMHQVSLNVDLIVDGLRSVTDFIQTVEVLDCAYFNESLQRLPGKINQWAKALDKLIPFDKKEVDKPQWGRCVTDTLWKLNDEIEGTLLTIGAVLEWAKKIRDDGWGEATFDHTLPDGYEGSWNLEEPKDSQVTNFYPKGAKFFALCGPNMSGKSWYMRSDLLLRMAVQSLGFGPFEQGNFTPMDGFYFLDRASTDADNDLSAYMCEIENLKESLSNIHGRSRVYIDEGYSTTSPDGQARMLLATGEDIIDRGGTVVIGTHNDVLLDRLYALGFPIWHLKTELGQDGELIKFFELEPGLGESHAIATAKARNVSPWFIARAEAYLNGIDEVPEVPVKHPYAIEVYTAGERGMLKGQSRTLDHIFIRNQGSSLFHRFSFDADFRSERLLRDKEVDPDVIVGGFDEEMLQAMIGEMILENSGISSKELLERQKMFGELIVYRRYQRLLSLIGETVNLDSVFSQIRDGLGLGLVKALNPLRNNKGEPLNFKKKDMYDLRSALYDSVVYLRILARYFANDNEYAQHIGDLYEHCVKESTENAKGIKRDIRKLLVSVQRIDVVLPEISLNEFDIESQKEDLQELVSRHGGRVEVTVRHGPFQSLERKINQLQLAEGGMASALIQLGGRVSKARVLSEILHNSDSVYLHQVANVIDGNVNGTLQEFYGNREEFSGIQLEPVLAQIAAVSYLAAIFDHEGFTSVEFNDTGEIWFESVEPLLKKKNEGIPHTVYMAQDELVKVITGPNGSGKTFLEKDITLDALVAMATGYIPGSYGTMPIVDAVVYFDRVTQKEDKTLSAGSQEMEYWKRLIALIESGKHIFAVASIDELGSTMSPRYQEAFSHAMVMTFLAHAHKMLLATHNHTFVKRLLDIGIPGVAPYHMGFDIHDSKIYFDRTIQPGIADSYPIEIARVMGFPESILQRAQQVDL